MKFTCLVATVIAPEPAVAQEQGRKLQTVKELQEQGKEINFNSFGCWLLIPAKPWLNHQMFSFNTVFEERVLPNQTFSSNIL